MKQKILLAFVTMMLISMACTITIPFNQIVPQEIQEYSINENLEDLKGTLELEINMGAGELFVNKAPGNTLAGTIQYNFPPLAPSLTREGNKIKISQTEDFVATLPIGKMFNRWELNLADVPTDLSLHAGAYNGKLNLSGIPLKSLEITDGASSNEVQFNEINPVRMELLSYTTGASNVSLMGLANANFSRMSFSGGAGDYLLDFHGILQDEAEASINLGVGSMTIIIPAGLPAHITFNGELTNVTFKGVWEVEDDVYITAGDGPVLEIVIDINLGQLELIHESEVISLPYS